MVLWPEIQGIVAIPHDGQPLPQGPHYADWLLPIVRAVERVLIPGGVLALNLNGQAAWTFPEEVVVRVPRETGLVLHERVCWVKTNAIPVGRRESHLIPEWEPIWVFRKGGLVSSPWTLEIRGNVKPVEPVSSFGSRGLSLSAGRPVKAPPGAADAGLDRANPGHQSLWLAPKDGVGTIPAVNTACGVR